MDYETAVKVSAGFGGGMYLGSVCGAVTGAIMAIGCKQGGAGMQAQARTAKTVHEFAERFKARHRAINCPELLGGVDLSKLDPLNNPEALKTLMASNVFAPCPGYDKDAAAIAVELLNPAPAGG